MKHMIRKFGFIRICTILSFVVENERKVIFKNTNYPDLIDVNLVVKKLQTN